MDYKTLLPRLGRSDDSEGMTVALELGSASIAMAAVRRAVLPDGKETRTPVAVESAGDAAGAKRFVARWPKARLIAGFPRQHAIVRFLDLPSIDKQELRAMARLQALAGLPFPEEELVSDIVVLGSDREAGRSRVLLVVVRRSALAPFLELFEDLGRYPDGFALGGLSVIDFIRWNRESVPAKFLHVGLAEGWLNLAAFADGTLASTRSIPCGQKDLDIPRIVAECRQTLAGGDTDAVFVGEGADRELSKALKTALKAPVEPLNRPSAEAAAIGAACADAATCLDLLPPELSNRESRKRARRELAGAAAWLGVWLAVLLGIGGTRFLRARWQLASLDVRLGKLEPASRGELPAEIPPLDILRELSRLTPSSVTLRAVSREQGSTVLLQGHAPQLSAIMDLVNGLQKSALFAHAQLRSSSLRSVQGMERVDFQINGEIRGGR